MRFLKFVLACMPRVSFFAALSYLLFLCLVLPPFSHFSFSATLGSPISFSITRPFITFPSIAHTSHHPIRITPSSASPPPSLIITHTQQLGMSDKKPHTRPVVVASAAAAIEEATAVACGAHHSVLFSANTGELATTVCACVLGLWRSRFFMFFMREREKGVLV